MHQRDTSSGAGPRDFRAQRKSPDSPDEASTGTPVQLHDPGTISLHHALNFCRHGHEVRDLSTQGALGHWVIWGHYACPQCQQVALDAIDEEPKVATIAGRRLQIARR